MTERFYINCPLRPGPVVLQGAEAHHLCAVRRLRPGDQVCLFNGDGHEYPAQILSADRRSASLEVLEQRAGARELPFTLWVAAPVPKGDRAQFLVEKLTELGVATYVPLSTQRSIVQPREAKLEKLQRYVIEASKQCRRNVLMQVAALTNWESYCRQHSPGHRKWLAHPGGAALAEKIAPSPSTLDASPPMIAAVGPEGGFTAEEVALAQANGWELVDLGPRILRTETAALVLAAWIANVGIVG